MKCWKIRAQVQKDVAAPWPVLQRRLTDHVAEHRVPGALHPRFLVAGIEHQSRHRPGGRQHLHRTHRTVRQQAIFEGFEGGGDVHGWTFLEALVVRVEILSRLESRKATKKEAGIFAGMYSLPLLFLAFSWTP